MFILDIFDGLSSIDSRRDPAYERHKVSVDVVRHETDVCGQEWALVGRRLKIPKVVMQLPRMLARSTLLCLAPLLTHPRPPEGPVGRVEHPLWSSKLWWQFGNFL